MGEAGEDRHSVFTVWITAAAFLPTILCPVKIITLYAIQEYMRASCPGW